MTLSYDRLPLAAARIDAALSACVVDSMFERQHANRERYAYALKRRE